MKKLLFLLAPLLVGGCEEVTIHWRDYYSEVVESCGYYVATPGFLSKSRAEANWTTFDDHFQGPECFDALNALVEPKLNESGRKMSAPFKKKFLEALQLFVGAPLALPPGAKIHQTIAIPDLIQGCIIGPALTGRSPSCDISNSILPKLDENLNRNLFNYVMNRFQEIGYEKTEPDSDGSYIVASYNPVKKRLKLMNYFWLPESKFQTPFSRMSILLHEARHHEEPHTDCTREGWGENCDDSLTGAYPIQVALFSYLLHGGAAAILDQGSSPLSIYDITHYAARSCVIGKYRVVGDAPAALREKYDIRYHHCPDAYNAGTAQILEWEGLQDIYASADLAPTYGGIKPESWTPGLILELDTQVRQETCREDLDY